MPLQFVTEQIANAAINSSKMNLTSGQTYDFSAATLQAGTPSAGSDVAIKSYVDNIAAGLYWKEACMAATAAALPACTYSNGSSGVGATLTADAVGALSVDGVAIDAAGLRVLVKNQAAGLQNGIYECTTVGDGSTAFVLTRTADMNEADEFAGTAVFVMEGTDNADNGFVCNTDEPITVGTTAIAFTQFTGVSPLSGGNGIDITSDVVSVDLAANSGLFFDGGALAIAANGVNLEKNNMRWKYEDFNTAASQFTINKTTSNIPADFRAADFFFVARNGQTLRAEAGTGTPSDDSGYKVIVDGSAIKVNIKNALTSGEILQVRYLYNA